MIQNFQPSEWKTEIWHELVFDDGRGNGLCFPCDENGKPKIDGNEGAQINYAYALEHPEKYVRFNKVIKRERNYKEPAHGTCECGEEVELYNQYMGACECPNCGRWYNLFGQELNPVNTWRDGDDW